MQPPVMIILRGKAGHFEGKDYPRGALDEASAIEYANRRGYQAKILDMPGSAYEGSPQVQAALGYMEGHGNVQALYGFSAGAYNVRHILDNLTGNQKNNLKLVVVLGAPLNPPELYSSPLYREGTEIVYRLDPPEGHMAGPRVLLEELIASFAKPAPEPKHHEPFPAEPAPAPDPWKAFFDFILRRKR